MLRIDRINQKDILATFIGYLSIVHYGECDLQRCKGVSSLLNKKSRVILVLVVISAVSAVLGAYYLTTLYGPSLRTVSPVQGQIQYSGINDTLESWNLTIIWTNNPWYARLNVTDVGYIGEVQLEWWLEKYEADSWVEVAPTEHITTKIELTGSIGQIIYSSSNGLILDNKNWGSLTTAQGEYRISIRIEIP